MTALNIPIVLKAPTLDPQKMEDTTSMMICHQIFQGLMRYTPSGDVENDLAESITISENRKSYMIKLKKAFFSDGQQIFAKDVVASFKRLFKTGASMAADMSYISGARTFQKTKDENDLQIREIDKETIEFHLDHPTYLFLKHLAAVDTSVLKLSGNKIIAGSGPYRLIKEDEKKIEIEMWRKSDIESAQPPKVINFVKINKADLIELALNGEVDSLDNFNLSEKEILLLKAKDWSFFTPNISSETFLIINPNYLPHIVRNNFAQSVSSTSLASSLSDERLVPARGYIPKGLLGFRTFTKPRTLAPIANQKPLEVEIQYSQNNKFHERIIEILSSQLAKFNFFVKAKSLDPDKFIALLSEKKGSILIASKSLDYPDPFANLAYFKSGIANNFFHINLKKVDNLLELAAATVDENARIRVFDEIQDLVLDQSIVIPLLFGSQASGLWSPKIKTMDDHPLGIHIYSFERIELRSL